MPSFSECYMKGHGLIEILIAIFIFSTMILSAGAMSLQSLKLIKIALSKTQELVQEQVILCDKTKK